MIRSLVTVLVVFALNASTFSVPVGYVPPALAGITLIGKGSIDGSAVDKSGLTGNICQAGVPANCVPKAIFGGFGSDLTYTGHDGVFLAAPDRGPFDGLTDVPYLNRFDFLHIDTEVGAAFPNIHTTLLDTTFLRNQSNDIYLGAAGAFDTAHPERSLRLDPEGIRVGPRGTFFVSDEYGPDLREFDRQGHLKREIP